ncbi:MAG: hypothetical protein ABFS86_12465 [Planctomycetota bacterium]
MRSNSRTVVGIDEAGYGPMLGPLVLGISVFRVSGDGGALSADLPVAVDDSKKLYSRATGLGRLEESVGAFREVAADADVPDDPGERPPWGLPADAVTPASRLAGELRDVLAESGVEVLRLATKTVPVRAFNAGVERTDSKAAVLFDAAMDLLAPWFDAEGPVSVVIDRHGGRKFYSGPLAGRFPERFHWVETEEKERSSYVFPAEDLRLSFEVAADARHRPVALASMAAKYVRERWMEAFNRWFAARDADLPPTAGYVTDARRWLADSAGLRARLGVSDDALVRVR